MDSVDAVSDQLAAMDLTSSPALSRGERGSGGDAARVQQLEAQLRRSQEALEQYRTICVETARADCVQGQPFYFMRSLFNNLGVEVVKRAHEEGSVCLRGVSNQGYATCPLRDMRYSDKFGANLPPGCTLLHAAAAAGQAASCSYLIRTVGIPADAADLCGRNALAYAVLQSKHGSSAKTVATLRTLVEEGADPLHTDMAGFTALSLVRARLGRQDKHATQVQALALLTGEAMRRASNSTLKRSPQGGPASATACGGPGEGEGTPPAAATPAPMLALPVAPSPATATGAHTASRPPRTPKLAAQQRATPARRSNLFSPGMLERQRGPEAGAERAALAAAGQLGSPAVMRGMSDAVEGQAGAAAGRVHPPGKRLELSPGGGEGGSAAPAACSTHAPHRHGWPMAVLVEPVGSAVAPQDVCGWRGIAQAGGMVSPSLALFATQLQEPDADNPVAQRTAKPLLLAGEGTQIVDPESGMALTARVGPFPTLRDASRAAREWRREVLRRAGAKEQACRSTDQCPAADGAGLCGPCARAVAEEMGQSKRVNVYVMPRGGGGTEEGDVDLVGSSSEAGAGAAAGGLAPALEGDLSRRTSGVQASDLTGQVTQ